MNPSSTYNPQISEWFPGEFAWPGVRPPRRWSPRAGRAAQADLARTGGRVRQAVRDRPVASPHAGALEERVAEHAVRLGRAPQPRGTARPRRRVNEPGGQGLVAHALHHGGERVPREALDPLRATRVDITHLRRHPHVPQPRLREQREELPAYERVASRPRLERDEAVDRPARVRVVEADEGRAVVAPLGV